MRMKKLKKGFKVMVMAMLLSASLAMTAAAEYRDTSDNNFVVVKKDPSGRIGKNMSLNFYIECRTGEMNNVEVGLSDDLSGFDYIYTEESFGDIMANKYPFEINETTFETKKLGNLKEGQSKSVSLSVKVRKDMKEGYYCVPIAIYEDGIHAGDDYINVWVGTTTTESNDEKQDDDVIFVMGENQPTPAGMYPNVMDFSINMRNKSRYMAFDVTVSMVLSKDSAEFPFSINDGNYDRYFEKLDSGEVVQVPYSMAIREDSYTGFYPIKFEITYRDSSEGPLLKAEETMYVNITSKSKEDSLGDFNINDRTKARLIVDSYSTVPEQIYAGDEFELILNMKNASTDVGASNILFTLEPEKVDNSAVFTTETGSSAVVVNSMRAGETAEIRMKFLAKAGIDQRSYSISIKEKYDSPEFKNAEETVTVDIPVKQIARLSTSTIEVMPESIETGSETNVMFGINNTGKVVLYNVNAAFEADSIKPVEAYVGNIKPGETGNVDVMVSGAAPTMDDGKVKIIISYEDENGEVSKVEKEMTLFVTEPMPEDMGMMGGMDMEAGMMDPMAEEPSFMDKILGNKLALAGIAAAVAAAAAGIVVWLKKRKKKKQEAAEEEGIEDEIS